jgi:tRNA threonylcarbamoyladenosine biosynthesis protein TsaE
VHFHYNAASPQDLDRIAEQILKDAGGHKLFAVHGEMGAGKTTLIRSLCKSLGTVDKVSSPTFAIMNEYLRSNGSRIYHFDFYRIKNLSEAFDLGYEQFFFSNDYCFVEWPEQVESLLNIPKAAIFITAENDRRNIELHT